MNAALQSLIDRYQPATNQEWENALREIVQELALLGLWRSRFFEYAAFVRDADALSLWSREFFLSLIDQLQCEP